jgi:hypothetical protein
MSHYEDLNTTKIALAGFIGAVLVSATTLLVMVLFHWEMAEQNQIKVINPPAAEYDSLVADQRAKLASYRWLDPEKKIVQIPIVKAMDLVLDDLKKAKEEKANAKEDAEKEGKNGS